MRASLRSAFTLVELLVVIAIIGILVSLLLPAVQSARESGRRTQCVNHLRQIGLAIIQHHDTYKTLPHGGEYWGTAPDYDAKGVPLVGEGQRAGWGFQILPFLEQQNIWSGGGKTTNTDRQIQAVAAVISGYFCPTRRPPQFYDYVNDNWYAPTTAKVHGLNDYAASTVENASKSNFGAIVRNNANQDDLITLSQIKDGTSNTMIIGEKRLNRTHLGKTGPPWVGDDNEGYSSGWDHDVIRFTSREPRPDYNDYNIGNDGNYRFGSTHSGGLNILLCDGSVRFLTFFVDVPTFTRIGQRHDGEPVTFP